MLLVGPEGAGKSHLAAIWARAAPARASSRRACSASADLPIALATGALVVEDLADGDFDERALFHLLNLAREEDAYLLITARTAPAGWRTRDCPISPRGCAPCRSWRWTPPDDALLRAVHGQAVRRPAARRR